MSATDWMDAGANLAVLTSKERTERIQTSGDANMSSAKNNGGAAVKREASGATVKREQPSGGSAVKREQGSGGSAVKKEVGGVKVKSTGKVNGSAAVKKESVEVKKVKETNGSGTVKREVVDVKKAVSASASNTTVKQTTVKKTVTKEEKKKVFSLPGQKHDPPVEREPLRIFYESLHEQRPDSEMAQFWMMEHGLLSPASAQRVFEKKQRKGNGSSSTPVKSFPAARDSNRGSAAKASTSNGKSAGKAPEPKGKRKRDDDSDDDLVLTKPGKRKPKTEDSDDDLVITRPKRKLRA
ncbi:hypothetical protein R1sor_020261 [Riccia sorocarpa]|uniref:Uncharacterized protein n=1 Tax=Riccia sorocarpa TaxID=122646 RepID=A0ABD3II68_9MARC